MYYELMDFDLPKGGGGIKLKWEDPWGLQCNLYDNNTQQG